MLRASKNLAVRKPIYLAAAALATFVALWGLQESGLLLGFLPYASVATICLAQFFRPLVALWWLIFSVFAVASTLYVFLLLRDIWRLATNVNAELLVDPSDALAFIIYILAVLAITFGLFVARPKTG